MAMSGCYLHRDVTPSHRAALHLPVAAGSEQTDAELHQALGATGELPAALGCCCAPCCALTAANDQSSSWGLGGQPCVAALVGAEKILSTGWYKKSLKMGRFVWW